MDRKSFIKKMLNAMLIGAPLLAAASCSSDDDDDNNDDMGPGTTPNCIDNGTSSSIGTNHGHTLSVPQADITAGVDKQYNIRGASDHPHTVTVSAANFAALQSNQSIQVASTSDNGHSHTINISCA
ncbi:MAG: hypothetical protein RJQ09_17615 [Cyclobacteriaceae bacterium]